MAITDSRTQVPGSDYNTDVRPGGGGLVPNDIFGESVRQITDVGAVLAENDLYSHCHANADGTLAMHHNTANLQIYEIATGTNIDNDEPDGAQRADCIWHPTNPELYYFFNGTALATRNPLTQTTANLRDFNVEISGAALEENGGSINWCDKTGNIFALTWDGATHVYNLAEDVIYSGTPSEALGDGYAGISPDGKFLVICTAGTTDPHYSYVLTHSPTFSIGPAVLCSAFGGSHGVFISASDGNNYVVHANGSAGAMIALTLNVDRSGLTNAQMYAAGTDLTPSITGTWVNDWGVHTSNAPIGNGQDWAILCSEATSAGIGRDNFNDVPGSDNVWNIGFKQEIFAINILTLEIRRFCHHRSRSIQTGGALSYYKEPHPSCSWDGSLILFNSDMNDSTPTGYNDMYAILNPFPAGGNGGERRGALRGLT